MLKHGGILLEDVYDLGAERYFTAPARGGKGRSALQGVGVGAFHTILALCAGDRRGIEQMLFRTRIEAGTVKDTIM